MTIQSTRGFQKEEMRGGERVRRQQAGWRGDEEEAVNFTLKLGGGGSVCDEDWNKSREGGGERAEGALHSAQRGGDWSRELESVRGALCSSGEGTMGRNGLYVFQRKTSVMISPSPAQPLNLDASFSFSSFLSISCCCFLGQNCRIVGKN